MKKKFVTLIRKTNSEKLGDLLERLNLEDREIENLADLELKINVPIRYNKINEILQFEKKHTLNYLGANL